MIRALLSLLLFFPFSSSAQDVAAEHDVVDGEPLIITLKMGAPAPWTGTLLSSSATAQIIAKSKFDLLECEATANKKLNDLAITSPKTGAIIFGGGVIKHHILNP